MDLLTIVIVLALLATAVTLLLGLISMSGGGSMNEEFGATLMWVRVGLQAFAIVMMFIAIWLHR